MVRYGTVRWYGTVRYGTVRYMGGYGGARRQVHWYSDCALWLVWQISFEKKNQNNDVNDVKKKCGRFHSRKTIKTMMSMMSKKTHCDCSDQNPAQVAELGGWLHEFHTIAAVDKELDAKPEKNHQFLSQKHNLLERKKANPRCRVTAANNTLKESISVQEEKTTGLNAPKMQWMELSLYEQKYGPADPKAIRVHNINGKAVTGVDFIEKKDRPMTHCMSIIC